MPLHVKLPFRNTIVWNSICQKCRSYRQFLNDSERVPCQVIAVIEDLPQNSHFNFEYLESMTPDVADYDGLEFFIYLKFRKGVH